MISRVAYTIRNTFFRRGAFVSSKGGACAMAQWHNGQSKTVSRRRNWWNLFGWVKNHESLLFTHAQHTYDWTMSWFTYKNEQKTLHQLTEQTNKNKQIFYNNTSCLIIKRSRGSQFPNKWTAANQNAHLPCTRIPTVLSLMSQLSTSKTKLVNVLIFVKWDWKNLSRTCTTNYPFKRS